MIKTINNLKNSLSKLSKSLMVGALLCLGFTANAQVCNASFTYTTSPSGAISFSNTSGGAYTSIYWDFGNGTSSSQNNPTAVYNNNGTYTACLTISDSMGGCFSTFCDTITITTGGTLGGCNASFVAFDSAGYGYFWNQSTAAANFVCTWNFGDGSTATTSNGASPTHQYAAAGVYNICLTIFDATNNCTDIYCDSLVIGQGSGASCTAYFSAATSGSTATFTDLSSGAGALSYSWDYGDGSTSTSIGNNSHTYALNGTYYVCLTISDTVSSCSNTYCNYVVVGNPAGNNCSASFYLVQDSTNMYNYTAVSYASTGALYSYFWDFGDGSSSTQQYPTHTYAGVGPYVLCLTVTDNVGCTATQCDSLYAGRSSNAITLNVVQGASTGIEENQLISGLQNYPNPFSTSTNINYSLTTNASVELSIIDLLGNKVMVLENSTKNAGTHNIELNAENLAEGMYLLQLKANDAISTKKMIINK
ncbi:MAG: PKD domain-containing protein [Bacteroidia bacterium]|nr:PKD domain-containing protein [Bacteroidia bacterium]